MNKQKKNEAKEEKDINDIKETEIEETEKIILEEKLTELDILRQSLEDNKKISKDYYDQLLRLKAEFENYRKRVEKERSEIFKFSQNELVLKLLSILDDFDKANESINKDKNIDNIVLGLNLIYKNFVSLLEKEGVKKQDVLGKIFDPHVHHAVMYMDSDEYDDNEIIEELQKGYGFNEKIIRPAMVKVNRKIEKKESNYTEEASNDKDDEVNQILD